MLKGEMIKELYEMKGEGQSIRGIARELGISRNSVRKYLRASELPQPKPRPLRGSKLDPYAEYVDLRLSEGLENCVVLLRELRSRGYQGGYTTLSMCGPAAVDAASHRRRPDLKRSLGSRLRWTGAASPTPVRTGASGDYGPS